MALPTPFAVENLALNIVIAVIILLLGFVVGKIAGNLIIKLFSSLDSGRKKKNLLFRRRFSSFVSFCIYVAAVILALERVGITFFVLKILLAVVLIIILGTVIFALLNFFLNFFYGLRILTAGKFRKGDVLKIKKIEGIVEKIGFAFTRLRTPSGELFVFPNNIFFKYKFSIERKKQ